MSAPPTPNVQALIGGSGAVTLSLMVKDTGKFRAQQGGSVCAIKVSLVATVTIPNQNQGNCVLCIFGLEPRCAAGNTCRRTSELSPIESPPGTNPGVGPRSPGFRRDVMFARSDGGTWQSQRAQTVKHSPISMMQASGRQSLRKHSQSASADLIWDFSVFRGPTLPLSLEPFGSLSPEP